MTKVPYERTYSDWGKAWERVYPTGKCKTRTVTDENDNLIYKADYIQVWVMFLGFSLWARWVNKVDIQWRSETIEYYDCKNESE
jgi:hypothetical protein